MSSRLTRPPYVLGHNADQAGCGHHRIIYPLQNMARLGVMIGRCDMQIWNDDMLKLMAPDVVVWQRQNEPHQVETMARYKKTLPDACMVYEIDDALWAVPAASYHRPYIAHDIDERIGRATQFCDVITVSTSCLQREMRRICGDRIPVRVVPNMLGRPSFQQATHVRMANMRPHRKPRVGWGGGISHTGDLALITDAMASLGDKIEWVFLGMKPQGLDGIVVEYHNGVPPQQYLATLAALDLDLMLAPLEDNLFNRCKSNLRLIEAGACRFPVIASPVEPYTDGNPPIRYAETSDAWISEIEQFLAMDHVERKRWGDRLNEWAERNYCLDEKVDDRSQAWLPGSTKAFRPNRKVKAAGITLLSSQPTAEMAALGDIDTTMDRACHRTGHVIYVAPGAHVTKSMIDRLVAHLESDNVACATALSNDGGLVGFPAQWRYTPIDPVLSDKIDAICAEEFKDASYFLPFATGSLIALSRHALEEVGKPRFVDAGQELSAIVEWSMLAVTRGKRIKAAVDVFAGVSSQPQLVDMESMLRRGQLRYPPPDMPMDPLVEVRAQLELSFHREHYHTALPAQQQGYPDWCAFFDEVGVADEDRMMRDAGTRAHPSFCVAKDLDCDMEPQTWKEWVGLGAKNVRQLESGAPNAEWFVFARSNATIRRHALYMLAEAIRDDSGLRLIYSDHDWKTGGVRAEHDMKPNFDHDMLLARDYMTPFFAVHRELLAECENFDIDDTGLYAIALDAVRHADRSHIGHIPRILVHLNDFNVEKECALAARKLPAAAAHAAALGWDAEIKPHPQHRRYAEVSWKPPADTPLVSIIVPTKDRRDMLEPCIESLLARTRYPNYELIIVDNGSTNQKHREYLDSLAERQTPAKRVAILPWPHAYNWSALNNFAADFASGDLLLFLNDDTRFVEDHWLDEMVGARRAGHVGAVGARLLYPIGAVQHVGVVSNRGMTGHIHKGLPQGAPGYNGYAVISHEASAVTGACLLVAKGLFYDAGKFPEDLAHNFNDVAFCLTLRDMGYVNVVAARAQVQHIEGATRPSNMRDKESHERIAAEGRILQKLHPKADPYWNPNMLLVHYDGGVMVSGMAMDSFVWPGPAWPWRDKDWPREGVLLIGDDGTNLRRETAEGSVLYLAQVQGFQMRIFQPPLTNVAPWDIRYPGAAARDLKWLGIERVVLRSIVGCPVEMLGFLTRLGIKVVYRPANAEAICPWTNFQPMGQDCGEGWKHDACGACIAEKGSPFGFVSAAGWADHWHDFLTKVTVDERDLSDVARSAMRDVYGPAGGEVHAAAAF